MTARLLEPKVKNKKNKEEQAKNNKSICMLCLPKEKWFVSNKKKKE